MSDFVHLHLHSQFSLLDGANRLDDVVAAAAAAGMPAMALTDHGNMFGAIEFYKKAKKAGVKPIVGIEAYTTSGRLTDRDPANKSSNHLVLLAKNHIGYKNLIKLSTRAFLEGFYYKPRMDKELLRQHSEGIIALSACLKGEINEKITANREHEAEASAREMLDIFGPGNFYLELQNHGIPEQIQANEVLRRIGRKLGIPLVVTNDCHYLEKDDAFPHDVLLCIGTQRMVHDTDRMKYASEEFYLKSAEEIHRLFPDDPQAVENTLAIAEQCDLTIPMGDFHLPKFDVPPGYTLDSYFEEKCREGLEERLAGLKRRSSRGLARHGEAAYRQRLETEIGIIRTMGFPGYFLVVWDFIRQARQEGIPVGPGRGSAAGSLVSYCLRITNVDPLEYDLLFERFLNPERISMPDIDIDFCMRRRGEVIQYVTDLYGRDKVSQIITFGTLAAKAVIRDVGRVMGLPYAQVDQVAKLVPDMTRSLADEAKDNEGLKAAMAKDPQVRQVVQVGSRLCGLTRHASVHAAGVVITPEPLDELVPLYRVKKGDVETVTTQWDKDVVEELGLLKMDFLGLRTLTVLDDTVQILKQQGVDVDLDRLPLDDPEVYRLFCEGRTNGVFQFESGGMKDLLRRARPSKFEDLAAFNALYRPGALSVGMVDEYIERKQGKRKVDFILDETREILEETYGVIVYQEQVMLIAVAVAGFTMAQADILRKAMGKKKIDVMAKMKEQFLDGAEARGHDRKKAQALWDYIEPFAGYGFNKSHSVAYALLAYQTAYLKAHHPVPFMAAMLNSELSSSDNVDKYLRECRDMGIDVLPPDVNESGWGFTVVGGDVRFGLGGVKGVGEGAVESILGARHRVGRFDSLSHVASEVDLRLCNHKVFECLVKAGCFDSLGVHRAALLDFLDAALGYAQKVRRERDEGQGTLFGGAATFEPVPDENVPEWPESERLSNEKEALGFYLTGNPLSEYLPELERRGLSSIARAKEAALEYGDDARVGGLVTRVRLTKIKSGVNEGRPMIRFVLEDLTGTLPVVLFANQTEQLGRHVVDEAVVVVQGSIRERGSDCEMNCEELEVVPNPADRPPLQLDITLGPRRVPLARMQQLKDLLTESSGGDVPVRLRVELDDRQVLIAPSERFVVKFCPELVQAVEALTGRGSVTPRYAPRPGRPAEGAPAA
jgi:DNA polymerase III subunit alpha